MHARRPALARLRRRHSSDRHFITMTKSNFAKVPPHCDARQAGDAKLARMSTARYFVLGLAIAICLLYFIAIIAMTNCQRDVMPAMATRNQKLDSDRGGAKSRAAAVEARKKQADARAAQLAPIVAGLWASGITSWDGIAKALNARGIPTAAGHGIWEPKEVRRVMARLK